MNQQTSTDGTVGKALDVLDLVATSGRPARFSELLDKSPHPKATLHRLLQTLVNQGMLTHDSETHTYALGLRLVQLAHSAWRQSSLAPLARDHIDALARDLGETIHLAQMQRGQVLYVDKRNAQDPIEMFSQAGKIGPGYCTGVGKAIMAYLPEDERTLAARQQSYHRYTQTTLTSPDELLAELDEIKRDGIAFDREEHEPGIICIAAPIFNDRGRAIGALSVTTSTDRSSLSDLLLYRPALEHTAGQIKDAARNWQFPTEQR
ncbi:MAG: IclR family transcriptional regulator [Rhodobacteraceae bacterium]|nr:IclR family transcriptional regulator [Paracoccaceae bacterium]